MAKNKHHNNNNNNNGRRFNNNNNDYNSNNNFNRNKNNGINKQQQLQQVQKKKVIPVNNKIKGPLFDKSKLSPIWQISRKIGPGLINGQNTCFLNSVLECLTYTPPLAQHVLKELHKKSCRIEGFCALCAMETHVRRCLKDPKSMVKGAAILPGYFTGNLKALSKTLRLGRQEDAHELYLFLLSAFQKSSTYDLGKLPPKVEETAFIYQIFGGKLQSQLKCFSCKATSNTFEACLDLGVDLNKASSVQDALDNFTKVDIIGSGDPSNRYKCDSCKQMVKAGKQMTINELPMMLTIHLKRFAFDLQRGYMRKITNEIKYPEILDMAPYVSKEKKISKAIYNLYAVLVHLGYGCDSGHYYAYVKAPNGQWYRTDDEDVEPVSIKEVLSQNSYMLFYQQETQSLSLPSPPSQPIEIVLPVPKKAIVDIAEKKKQQETADVAVKKRRVVIEPKVVADHPQSWVMQSADKPHRSLRGNMSPPTFGAAVSDESTWSKLSRERFLQKQKERKRRVFKKGLESRKSPWNVSGYKGH